MQCYHEMQFSIIFKTPIATSYPSGEMQSAYCTASANWAKIQFNVLTWTLNGFKYFTNGPGDQGSIPGRVIPKTQKMVLDAALLNTQYYKIRVKGKVEQSWEWSCSLPYTLM